MIANMTKNQTRPNAIPRRYIGNKVVLQQEIVERAKISFKVTDNARAK